MDDRYAGAKWGGSLAEDAARDPRVDDPSLEQLADKLRHLAQQLPDCVRHAVVGHSVAGHDLHLVEVSDFGLPDEDKQVALFFGAEHGNEHSSTTALLTLLDWLVTPEAEHIRRRQRVLLVPCVNPDGYDTFHFQNMNGVNLYADYSLTGEPTQPESRAIWEIINREQPEVIGACHGAWRVVRYAFFENCQGSYGTSRFDRTHSRLFAEEVLRACEEAGYPQDRMEEDCERILSPLPGFENHSFRSGEGITAGVYAYNCFHSMLFSMEIMYEQSGLAKLRKILELGNEPWRYEQDVGYPVRVVLPPEPFAVAAYGQTAARRRRSRVELWQNNSALTRYQLPQPQSETLFGLALSIMPEDRECGAITVDDALQHFGQDPNIESEPLRQAFGPLLTHWWARYDEPRGSEAKPAYALDEIRHGLALRVRMLPGSRVRRVLINGREAPPSAADGYETWTPPGHFTLVQINLPPGRSLAAPDGRLRRVVCTIEMAPGRVGR